MKGHSLLIQFLAIGIAILCRTQVYAEPPLFQIRAVADAKSTESQIFVLTGKNFTESIPVEPAICLSDADIQSAKVQTSPDDGPGIVFTLTEAGRKRWSDLTTKYVGRRLALFLQGRLISAPSITQRISGKTIEISGGFTEPEAVEFVTKFDAKSSQ